mgnify:CR=1 FL=1
MRPAKYKSVKNKALKQQAIDAGVPQSVADKAFNGEYKKWLDAINLYTPKRPNCGRCPVLTRVS